MDQINILISQIKFQLRRQAAVAQLLEHSVTNPEIKGLNPEAVFLVVCDPTMNEL
jgi:hypothetical protein